LQVNLAQFGSHVAQLDVVEYQGQAQLAQLNRVVVVAGRAQQTHQTQQIFSVILVSVVIPPRRLCGIGWVNRQGRKGAAEAKTPNSKWVFDPDFLF
jgi:hypothetical protein